MSTQEPGRAIGSPALTALPRAEDLPLIERGYDPDRVRDAFEAYRRHVSQLQAQLRVLQAAGRTAQVEPTGHSVRMDALHLIRAAAEFADTLERDAQKASAAQLARTEAEVRRRQRDLQEREGELERYRVESERQRGEILNAARAESREIVAEANRDATQELREAESRAARLLEQSRHQATELTNAARAEVEQTLEWSRSQSNVIVVRAREGAEQLLRAAGLGEPALTQVAEAIVRSAEAAAEPAPGPSAPQSEAWDAPPPPPPTLAPPPPPSGEAQPDDAGEEEAAGTPPPEEAGEGESEGTERRE